MPCSNEGRNCELPRETKHRGCNMLNAAVCQPDMSSWLMAVNAGSVTESLAALDATG
jgi:hypothetical protein